jgi:dATP/dGTP diphosphohydrolase
MTNRNTVKATNPKDAVGVRKMPFSVLPWRVLCGVALAMLEGACKYGRHNYRAAGVRASVYFDAVVGRHLTDWWEGVDIDPDSGLHHIDKAIAGLMVMRDSILQGNFTDDRPPRGNLDMAAMNRAAAEIMDVHADKNPRHFTIEDSDECA